MQNPFRVYTSVILSMLFWAFSFVWIKIAYESFLPITTIFLRLVISTAILMVGFALAGKIQKIQPQHYKWFLLLALFEPFLYFMGESFGLQVISSTTGSVIISTIPLLTPISAFLFFRERVTLFNIAGLIISFIGVIIIVVDNQFKLSEPINGIILMFFAVFSALGYGIMVKKMSSKYNAYTITGYQNLFGLIMFLPFFIGWEWNHFVATMPSSDSMIAVVELAIFASTFSFLLFTYGINHLGLAKASMFANTIPVFTAILAWWILDDVIDVRKIIGIIIVVGGLFLSNLNLQLKNAR